jgi:hypothetical protein
MSEHGKYRGDEKDEFESQISSNHDVQDVNYVIKDLSKGVELGDNEMAF